MKKEYQMTNKKVITSLISASILLTFNSFSAYADDCSISINSKESVKCLERKISKLEKQLEESKESHLVLPKGAIITFKAKACPVGWNDHQLNENGIVNLNMNQNIIKCEKS